MEEVLGVALLESYRLQKRHLWRLSEESGRGCLWAFDHVFSVRGIFCVFKSVQ